MTEVSVPKSSPSGTSVLVAAGSKYGATAEIATHIGNTLRARGLDVTVLDPEQVSDPGGYQAIVLGSAVYMGRWRKDARRLADRVALVRGGPDVWLFSSGPIGDPPKPDEMPVDVEEIRNKTAARDHVVFPGKVVRDRLNFGDRAVLNAFKAPEGDFRDWDEITAWAERIADSLT